MISRGLHTAFTMSETTRFILQSSETNRLMYNSHEGTDRVRSVELIFESTT